MCAYGALAQRIRAPPTIYRLTAVLRSQLADLQQFRQWESKTPGHPENFMTAGIEVTTGAARFARPRLLNVCVLFH